MCASCSEGPNGASFIVVKRCCEAWNRALALAQAEQLETYKARKSAAQAYRLAMPFLCGQDNIRGFIAAVAQGMLLEVFDEKEGTKLVYVAQVALSALPRPARAPVGRPRKNAETQPEPETAPEPRPQSGPDQSESASSAPAIPHLQSNPEPQSAAPQPPGDGDNPVAAGNNPGQGTIPSIEACAQEVQREPTGTGSGEKINTPHPPSPSQMGRTAAHGGVNRKINTPPPPVHPK